MSDHQFTDISQVTSLECPCCGDDGAVSNSDGEFCDGQALMCGCVGWVSVDVESEEAWINNGEDKCPPTATCKREAQP